MPENIRFARNVAIILSIVEFICVIASFGFYIRRRSKIILAIIIFAFIACLWGIYAKVKLSFWGLFGHALFTIGIIGGFLIYCIIDSFASSDKNEKGGMSETFILILLLLPMMLILAMGIYSLILVLYLDTELEEREKTDNERNERRKRRNDLKKMT